jgi:hypothetical protein
MTGSLPKVRSVVDCVVGGLAEPQRKRALRTSPGSLAWPYGEGGWLERKTSR